MGLDGQREMNNPMGWIAHRGLLGGTQLTARLEEGLTCPSM